MAVLTDALEDEEEDDKFFVVESDLVETMVSKILVTIVTMVTIVIMVTMVS